VKRARPQSTRPSRLSEPSVTVTASVEAHFKQTLQEVALQLELDETRGAASLQARARGLRQARVAGDGAAERQALIDLAAVCIALAARAPGPRVALAQTGARAQATRPRSRHSRARVA
jgi:hypothetical protein